MAIKYLIDKLIVQVKDIKFRLERKFKMIEHYPNWVQTKLEYFSNLITNLENLFNIPKQVKTCLSCLEICLSDEKAPRCFECEKDNIQPLQLKMCLCGKKFPWVKKDGITRCGNKCDKCSNQIDITKKTADAFGWKRKRCLSCTNFTVSKLSKFCFNCDPRKLSNANHNIKNKQIVFIRKKIEEHAINSTNSHSEIKQDHVMITEQSITLTPIPTKLSSNTKNIRTYINITNQNILNSNVNEWNYTKLENPGLNLCFLNSAVQFILSIKPLTDLLCCQYVKNHCRNSTFLSEFEQLEMIENANQSISLITLAKKNFLFEFESLAINMIRHPQHTFSTSKLAKVFEVLEPDYTYLDQWDCSSVVDLFFTLYDAFIGQENFEGKNDAQAILDSLKITMNVCTTCNMCNITIEREMINYFFMVPLERNVDNIFIPYHEDIVGYRCEMCNELEGIPHQGLITGATRITEIKSFSKYVLVKFGRVKLNYEKVTFTVTLPEINNILGCNLQLEAWVEHIGATIKSGHYVLIRRMKEVFIKISDDDITSHLPTYIQSSPLCYIALLKRL